MKLTCRHYPGATLFTVAGQVDISTSAELEEFIGGQRRRFDDHVIVDMRELTFIDSSGLAVLLAAGALARAHGADLHLAGVQPMPARLLEITGADRAATFHDDVEQALAAVLVAGHATP